MEYVYSVLWWVYVLVFLVLVLLATGSVDHLLKLRKLYIEILLKLFAFGQERVERKRLSTNKEEPGSPAEEIERPRLSFQDPKAIGIKDDIKGFQLDDTLEYMTAGMGAIVDDSLTKHFEPEELPVWNLLSRTNDKAYEFISLRLTVCWILGFLVRYFILFPLRLIILFMGLCIMSGSMVFVGTFPNGKLKSWLNSKALIFCCDFVAWSLSLVATFHNEENKPKHGIAVANHTSPIDSMILATNNCYDMVGQKHEGILGYVMNMMSRASTHVWFQRSDEKDRAFVVERLREHAQNPDLPPVLIFPEGVCVNNTSVMQFKKGSFEIDSVVYPIAIRFDARFGDPFWWQDKFFHYILYMMTSWAIVCNVWYLPPMERMSGESAIAFAERVKAKIAHQGGMVDLPWDGFLKAKPVKGEWKKRQQEVFAEHLKEQDAPQLGNCLKEKEE